MRAAMEDLVDKEATMRAPCSLIKSTAAALALTVLVQPAFAAVRYIGLQSIEIPAGQRFSLSVETGHTAPTYRSIRLAQP